MEKIIRIPYSPRTWSKELHDKKKRWNVIVAHRRSGKTTATLNHLQRDALIVPNSRYAYIAPTYKQAKNIAWDIIKYYSQPIPNIDYNESELTVKYPNGSKITLYGADNPDSLRGIGLWGVVFDEYSQQPSNIFSEIIRPALSDHEGYGIWIGTPKGKNDFFRLYEKARQEESWYHKLLKVSESKLISDLELADARKVMTLDEYEQEYECSFEASIKGAYYAQEIRKARDENRIISVPHYQGELVHTWWDLGVSDSTSIGFFQKVNTQWRIIDYHEASGEGLPYYIKVLSDKKEKEKYLYGYHYGPHDLEVRELGTGQTRKEMAHTLGIDFEIAPKLPIMDGIHALRMRFDSLWIDEIKCARLLDALSLYQKEWDDKRGDFRDKPLHDWTSHASDMMRYWAVTNFEPDGEITSHKPSWDGY